MDYPHIFHHGAIERVTGSCHQLLLTAADSLLVDCGADNDGQDMAAPDVDVSMLKALVITHVHNDHVGRLPALMAAGYRGPVLCSEPSAKLLPLVIEDVLRHNAVRDDALLRQLERQIMVLPFDQWFELISTDELCCRLRLQRAGHILGSAYVECDIRYSGSGRATRVVFSGDIGACQTPILRSLRAPEYADILVLESTYGDRLQEDRGNRQQRLEKLIDQALADGGTVLLPAFSIGRTQELLYELEDILQRKALSGPQTSTDCPPALAHIDWQQLPVILDSPLASRFTQVYRSFKAHWDADAQQRLAQGRTPLAFRQLITIDSHAQHQQVVNYLSSTLRPAIVIAGHGMCAGGRIVNYLKAMLEEPRHQILFVGYQARGTPGSQIQRAAAGRREVSLDGQCFAVKAGVSTVGGYSAHADQAGLLSFVRDMQRWPDEIRLVHGEVRAKRALGSALTRLYANRGKPLRLVIPGGG